MERKRKRSQQDYYFQSTYEVPPSVTTRLLGSGVTTLRLIVLRRYLCNGVHIIKRQHGNPVKLGATFGGTTKLPSRHTSIVATPWEPHHEYSTWIFDRRYGYYAASFGGTARLNTKLLRGSFYSNLAVDFCLLQRTSKTTTKSRNFNNINKYCIMIVYSCTLPLVFIFSKYWGMSLAFLAQLMAR